MKDNPGALSITVVCDNNPYEKKLQTAWGFSALITGTEKTILFDTGPDGALLLNNMKKLAIEPQRIDVAVLSHIHADHTAGLNALLEKNANLTVCLLKSFPQAFKDHVRRRTAKVIEIEQPADICKKVYSTGRLGTFIKEQSLIIRTEKGLVVITGCAHPGIVKIAGTAKSLLKQNILLVMGGFHLEWSTKAKVENIIAAFKKMNVRYAGPCHCTGEKARELFKKHYGQNYIDIGVGKTIKITDLT